VEEMGRVIGIVESVGWRVESGGWRLEGGGWRVERWRVKGGE